MTQHQSGPYNSTFGLPPVIVSPPYGSVILNSDFESPISPGGGPFPDGWLVEVGTASRAADPGFVFRGAYSAKMNPTASAGSFPTTSLLYRISPAQFAATFPKLKVGVPFFVWFVAAVPAGDHFTLFAEAFLTKLGGTANQHQFDHYWYSTQAPWVFVDNNFRLYRAGPFYPTASDVANADSADIRLATYTLGGTVTAPLIYIDAVCIGVGFDGIDTGQGQQSATATYQNGRPLFPDYPYNHDKVASWADDQTEAGYLQRTTFHGDYRRGSFKMRGLSPLGVARWREAWGALKEFRPFSIFHDYSRLDRDYINKAVIEPGGDGIVPINGTSLHELTLPFKESA